MRKNAVSTADRVALMGLMLVGAAVAAWSVIAAVVRIVEVLPNQNVEVDAAFRGTQVQAPVGPGGALVDIELRSAVLTVPELPAASLWSIVIQQVLVAAGIATFILCLLLLSRSVLRESVFSKLNTRLVSISGMAALLAIISYSFFGNMAANGAFAILSDRDFDNVVVSVDVSTVFLAGFVAALASTVFMIGERLQRDTEGLV